MDKTDSDTWALFLTAHAALVGEIERRLKQAELPPLAWYDVLWALERAPEQRLRMNALADALVLTRFNATRLVDRLVAAGLVARKRTSEDRRGACAVLTARGRALRAKIWPVYRAAIAELFNRHLSDAQHGELQDLLRRLLADTPSPSRR
jgi:DNA-binding MarR family transcriptional regulator